MRVLHVTEASTSGTFAVVRTLCERLAKNGHDVALACGRRPETPADAAGDPEPAVEYVTLPWQRRSVRAHAAAARALRALVRTWRPDIVHLHSAFAGFVGVLALGRSGIPLVYTAHGSPLGRTVDGRLRLAAYARLEGFVARRVALVGAVSAAEAALVAAIAPSARIAVVANGIAELDEGALPEARGRSGARVVALGRIVRQRRPAETARILSALAPQAEVLWIGDGPPAQTAAVRAAGVPITGWLPRAQALDRLAAATVLVHWSASDGAALAILEAMARDVVVVASDIAPNRELVGDAQTCGEAEEAVALVRAVLADAVLRERLLAGQRERRERYGAADMTAGWVTLYGGLLGSESAGATAPCAPAESLPAGGARWS